MLPQSAKNKGRKLQKYIVERLLSVFGLEEGDCESRPMGSSGTDIMMSPKARRAIGISFECKSTKKHPTVGTLKQSRSNKHPGTLAAVVWKPYGAEYKDTMIAFNFEEFINWARELRK